jgi:hypothetical protein
LCRILTSLGTIAILKGQLAPVPDFSDYFKIQILQP